jgi:hypothetical protein
VPVEPGEGLVLHGTRELVRHVVEPPGELLAGPDLLEDRGDRLASDATSGRSR